MLSAAAAKALWDDSLRRRLALHVVRRRADGIGPVTDGVLPMLQDLEEVAVELAVETGALVAPRSGVRRRRRRDDAQPSVVVVVSGSSGEHRRHVGLPSRPV